MDVDDALRPILLQAKPPAKGRALAELIKIAVEKPGLYVFGELLDFENVQQLKGSEFNAQYELLKLFAYGTFTDYQSNKDQYPELSARATIKLKQLSIVSLAAKSKVIKYSDLQTQLDIGTVRELEDLLIQSIYQGIIKAKLDQRRSELQVEYAIGRDLQPQDIDGLLQRLANWRDVSDKLLSNIMEKVAYSADVAESTKLARDTFEKDLSSAKEVARITADAPQPGGAPADWDPDWETSDFLGDSGGGFGSRRRMKKGFGKESFSRRT